MSEPLPQRLAAKSSAVAKYSSPSGAEAGADHVAVRVHLPGEVAVRLRHVRLGPLPQTLELGLLVQLKRDQHAVRHALAAHVVTIHVQDVGFVGAGLVVDVLILTAVEHLLERGGDFGLDLGVGLLQELAEQVAIIGGRRARGTRIGGGESGDRACHRYRPCRPPCCSRPRCRYRPRRRRSNRRCRSRPWPVCHRCCLAGRRCRRWRSPCRRWASRTIRRFANGSARGAACARVSTRHRERPPLPAGRTPPVVAHGRGATTTTLRSAWLARWCRWCRN